MRGLLTAFLMLSAGAAPLPSADRTVDVNGCTYEELLELPGIGPRLADEILTDFSLRGPFRSLTELERVKGIGPVLSRALAGRIRMGDRGEAPVSDPVPAPLAPLDLNRASAEELDRIPGIGPVMAARIVEDREMRGPFRGVPEIVRVRGIGITRAIRLRPHLTVGEEWLAHEWTE